MTDRLMNGNAGANSGIQVGDTFTVYRPGEELIDPQTGLSLGSESEMVGTVTVTEVQDKFSKASANTACPLKANDIVK